MNRQHASVTASSASAAADGCCAVAALCCCRGSLRHMSNAAFLLLVYAKQLSGISRDRAVCFAHGQMRYALGEAGR